MSLVRHYQLKVDPVRYARHLGVTVGEGCDFLNLSDDTFGSEPYLVRIGDRVTLSGPLRFVTHDGGVRVLAKENPSLDVIAPIDVGNDVFIGANVILLPGVSVGDRAVVGAGAVVTRDVPPAVVVAGNPARVIKTLEEYRESALQKNLGTRELSPSQKRRVLSERFPQRLT
jgi:acetyltransferase-like isoleucine patch superfamily enzyme